MAKQLWSDQPIFDQLQANWRALGNSSKDFANAPMKLMVQPARLYGQTSSFPAP